MEKIKCPICNSEDFNNYINLKDRFKISDSTFKLVKCKCNFIYLNPRPKEDNISKYYKHINYSPHSEVGLFYRLAQKFSFRWKYKLIKRYYTDDSKLLDYGSGKSEFGKFLEKKGIDVNNYEPILKTEDKNNLEQKYKIITLWHSLEHIHNLSKCLNSIISMLKPEGVVIIAVPNINAAEISFFKDEWIAYDAPRHLYHFNEKSIKNLLSNHGLKIIKSQTILQDTFYNILLSIKTKNIILKLLKFLFISSISYFKIIFNSNSSSSKLYLCIKK